MALYFSYPAVSQSCALTVAPSFIVTFLVANSTPIVFPTFFGREFFKYMLNKQVFPTATSPIRMTKQKTSKIKES